jgi:hypothetical protein
MALPTINDVAKVVVRGHIGPHPMQNVLHVRCDSPLLLAEAQTIGNDIGAAYDLMLDDINTGNGWDNMEIYDLATAGGPQFTILPATWPALGVQTNGSLPPQTSAVVALRGASGGRSGRGRVYVAGFDEDSSEGDSIDTGPLGRIQDFGDALVGLSNQLVIVSYFLGTDKTQVNKKNVPIPRVTPLVTDVTIAVARPNWANQRRRADLD